jgi:hypothetical protein
LIGGVIALLLSSPLAGQSARPADVESIDAIISAYYEVVSGPAGEVVDVARDQSLHHADAWVAIAGSDTEGRPQVRMMSFSAPATWLTCGAATLRPEPKAESPMHGA